MALLSYYSVSSPCWMLLLLMARAINNNNGSQIAVMMVQGFVPSSSKHQLYQQRRQRIPNGSYSTTSTSLEAINALVKKAKQAELREYVKAGIPDNVMEQYNIMKEKMDSIDLSSLPVGPLQESLTKRKGTITVIAEYKRKLSTSSSDSGGGLINEIYEPEILSPVFRDFGASAIAVTADERMGGCTYQDIDAFVEEQRRAAATAVTGPVPVINNDVILDELQIARSAAAKVAAVVISLDIIGDAEECTTLLKAAAALGLEAILTVSSPEQAQTAVDCGARMISVIHLDDVDGMVNCIASLPDTAKICKIANIVARNDKQLQEIEQAWAVRDQGFNCVWVGEALYKTGDAQTEHPGAIIKSMKSKSSLKWASPKASSGRGEGAREYLGDLLM